MIVEFQRGTESRPRETQWDARSQVRGQRSEELEVTVDIGGTRQVVAGCVKGVESQPCEGW